MKLPGLFQMIPRRVQVEDSSLSHTTDEFPFRPGRAKGLLKSSMLTILSIVLILAAWHLVALIVISIRETPFPTPLEVLERLILLFSGNLLYDRTIENHVMLSLRRWGTGYVLAVVTGLLVGMLLGAYRLLRALFMPAIIVLQLIPGMAWIPIAMLLFGLGENTTIFIIFMTALSPIIINTTAGIRMVPRIYTNVGRMIGLGQGEIFFKVLMPAALISIINGLRIAFAGGWRVLIAAEMIVGVSIGLGYSLIQARWSMDFEAALVCIVIICIFGLIMEKGLFALIEQRIMARQGLSKDAVK